MKTKYLIYFLDAMVMGIPPHMTGCDGLMFLKTDSELTGGGELMHAQQSCGLGSRPALYTSHCSVLKHEP